MSLLDALLVLDAHRDVRDVRLAIRLIGVTMYGSHFLTPAYSLGQVLIRGNVIRNINGASAPFNRAIELGGCEMGIMEKNIIDVGSTHPITHGGDGTVRTFNNLTPAGALIESFSTDTPTPVPAIELVTKVRSDLEDTMISALLNL